MGNRIEVQRYIIGENRGPTPLNLNQRVVGRFRDGERRFSPTSKKVARAEERRAQKAEANETYEEAKLANILRFVSAVKLNGYDEFCEYGFPHLVRYLRNQGQYPF